MELWLLSSLPGHCPMPAATSSVILPLPIPSSPHGAEVGLEDDTRPRIPGLETRPTLTGNPVPSYEGDNLVNLLAELEIRLTGRSPTRGLRSDLADLIPHKRNYVLVINDGLGARQLARPGAGKPPVLSRQHL